MEWVKENAGWDLKNFLLVQLRTEPDNGVRKRIKHIKENSYVISYTDLALLSIKLILKIV